MPNPVWVVKKLRSRKWENLAVINPNAPGIPIARRR
jgi:hypothetical protein